MIRAVLDANVFVSGILSHDGTPGRILRAWRDERFHLVVSERILEEIARVLKYPKISRRHYWSGAEIARFVDDLRQLALLTPGDLTLDVIREDPADNRYLECALEGQALYVVSGDHHLLDLAEFGGVEILSPRAFLGVLPK
jgi:putative PIN family toxin of toxin-antitoxin system